MKTPRLPKNIRIPQVEYIELNRRYEGGLEAVVVCWHQGQEKRMTFVLADNDLTCIAREMRKVLREKREKLAQIISVVEERV